MSKQGGIPKFLDYVNGYIRLPDILPSQSLGGGGKSNKLYKRTEKRFFYNNRNRVVYMYMNTKKEFIKVDGKYHPTSTLKKQTIKKLKRYVDYNGEKYQVHQRLDNDRQFIVVNKKKKYLDR